MEKGMLKVSVL